MRKVCSVLQAGAAGARFTDLTFDGLVDELGDAAFGDAENGCCVGNGQSAGAECLGDLPPLGGCCLLFGGSRGEFVPGGVDVEFKAIELRGDVNAGGGSVFVAVDGQVIADHPFGAGEAVGLGDADTGDVQFPAALPAHSSHLVAHDSHPFGRHCIRSARPRMTPGLITV